MRLGRFRLHKQCQSVQFSSVAQLCPALCDPMDCSTPGFPVHHQLPELTQTHILRVGDAIHPSHPVSPFCSLLQSFPESGSFSMNNKQCRQDNHVMRENLLLLLSHLVMSDSLWPHGLQPTRLLCPWDSPARILEWIAMPSSRGSSQPRV